jgi:hypothetical protein
MDVNELMAFKPATAPKRPAAGAASEDPTDGHGGRGADDEQDDPNASYESRAAKRRRRRQQEEERLAQLEAEAAEAATRKAVETTKDSLTSQQRQEVDAALEKGDQAEEAVMDETALK